MSWLSLPDRQPYPVAKLVVQQGDDSSLTLLGESWQNFQGLHDPG